MKKLLVLLMSFSLVLVLSSNVYAVNEWQEGTGENSILGTISPSDLDKDSFENVVDPLDRLLSDYRKGVKISYASASSLSVSAGQVTCDNSGRTIRKFRENTSATTVSFSDLDTGAEANDTYYVYAVADTSVTTFTIKISLSSTAPSGVTSFLKLGQFYNDSSSNIVNDDTLINDNDYNTHRDFGSWISKSNDTSYLASTDGFVMAYNITKYTVKAYTDGSNPPTTLRASERDQGDDADDSDGSITMPVKKGDYYKVTGADSIYWIPLE